MRLLLYAAAVAGALCALSSAANAAIVVSAGTLASPVVENFSGLASPFAPTTYAGGFVTTTYVGTTTGGINSNFLSNTNLSWRPLFGVGYTQFDFASAVDAFGFSAGHANNASPTTAFSLNGQVFNGSTLLTTFSLSGLTYAQLADFQIVATGSDSFTRVNLAANLTALGTGFQVAGFDRLIIDDLRKDDTGLTIAGVPEPAAWAMMLTGFFGAGLVVRRDRRKRPFIRSV